MIHQAISRRLADRMKRDMLLRDFLREDMGRYGNPLDGAKTSVFKVKGNTIYYRDKDIGKWVELIRKDPEKDVIEFNSDPIAWDGWDNLLKRWFHFYYPSFSGGGVSTFNSVQMIIEVTVAALKENPFLGVAFLEYDGSRIRISSKRNSLGDNVFMLLPESDVPPFPIEFLYKFCKYSVIDFPEGYYGSDNWIVRLPEIFDKLISLGPDCPVIMPFRLDLTAAPSGIFDSKTILTALEVQGSNWKEFNMVSLEGSGKIRRKSLGEVIESVIKESKKDPGRMSVSIKSIATEEHRFDPERALRIEVHKNNLDIYLGDPAEVQLGLGDEAIILAVLSRSGNSNYEKYELYDFLFRHGVEWISCRETFGLSVLEKVRNRLVRDYWNRLKISDISRNLSSAYCDFKALPEEFRTVLSEYGLDVELHITTLSIDNGNSASNERRIRLLSSTKIVDQGTVFDSDTLDLDTATKLLNIAIAKVATAFL